MEIKSVNNEIKSVNKIEIKLVNKFHECLTIFRFSVIPKD